MISLLSQTEVLKHLGFKKSTLYNRIQDGIFPEPINNGSRLNAWLESEVEAIIDATVKGKTKSETKSLVKRLLKKRLGKN